jgi:hypothetical protein
MLDRVQLLVANVEIVMLGITALEVWLWPALLGKLLQVDLQLQVRQRVISAILAFTALEVRHKLVADVIQATTALQVLQKLPLERHDHWGIIAVVVHKIKIFVSLHQVTIVPYNQLLAVEQPV